MKAHTFGAKAINGAKTEKMSSATAATTLRLPRSAQRARGTAQSSWATYRDEGHRAEGGIVDVERVLEVVADEDDAVPEAPGHERRGGEQHQWGRPVLAEDPDERRRFPSPVPGITSRAATASGVRLFETTSFNSSSGTAKSNCTWSAIGLTLTPRPRRGAGRHPTPSPAVGWLLSLEVDHPRARAARPGRAAPRSDGRRLDRVRPDEPAGRSRRGPTRSRHLWPRAARHRPTLPVLSDGRPPGGRSPR